MICNNVSKSIAVKIYIWYMKYLYVICLLAGISNLAAQEIGGKVSDIAGNPLVGASIYWVDGSQGVVSDELGEFSIKDIAGDRRLVFSYIGYKSDTLSAGTINYWNIQLIEDYTLVEVDIVAKKQATGYLDGPAKIESISSRELERAACCSLAGCFNTEASVQSRTTNVVNDSKELQLLGISGVYNQLLVDGLPLLHGPSYPYITGSYAGPMVKTIFVSKGANSVLQGFENIAGQINIIPKTALDRPQLFINGFASSFGVTNVNVNYNIQKDLWDNFLFVHVATPAMRRDINQDGFLDMPLTQRISLFNKWTRLSNDEKWKTEISARFWSENRLGGELGYEKGMDPMSSAFYGQTVDIQHADIYTRNEYRLDADFSLAAEFGGFYHHQESNFGRRLYRAEQYHMYGNAFADQYYGGDGNHNIKYGVSLRANNLDEQITSANSFDEDLSFTTNYVIPGVFIENSFEWEKLTVNTGLRADFGSAIRIKVTPRFLVRYKILDDLDIRVSAGSGFRIPTPIADRPFILANQRQLMIATDLDPEDAINMGGNIVYKLFVNDILSTWSIDVYHTRFDNQVFADYDTDPTHVLVDHLASKSVSNTLQIENKWNFTEDFEVKWAYNYQDVYLQGEIGPVRLPFNTRHRLLVNGSYSFLDTWQMDANYRWVGEKTLPITSYLPENLQRANVSDPFSLIDLQLTKKWDRVEVYAGVENMLNFFQEDPILDPTNPFGEYFDVAFNWGPTRGREFYVGFRYDVEKK